MRLFAQIALVAAVTITVGGAAIAQRPNQAARPPVNIGLVLLTNAELQKELKITDDQKKELKALMTKAEDLNKKRSESGRDRAAMLEVQKAATELGDDVAKAGDKTFTADQKKRLKQIDFQRQGLAAFATDDAQKALKITDEQKKAIKEMAGGYQKATQELRKEVMAGAQGRGTPEQQADIAKGTAKLTEETMAKLMTSMTDEQKKAHKELVGEKFDLAKLQPRAARRDN